MLSHQFSYSPTSHAADHTGIGTPNVAARSGVVRCATVGDSTGSVAAIQSDTTTVTAAFPVSGSAPLYQYVEKFPIQNFMPNAFLVRDCGISGQTTAQILARDNSAYSATRYAIADALDGQPDVVLARCGSINDLIPITSGTYAATVAATYANHCLILERLMSGAPYILDSGIFGYSTDTAANPALVRQALVELNGMYAAFAAQHPGRIVFQDPVVVGLSGSDGHFLPNISVDGTHLAHTGSFKEGAYSVGNIQAKYGVAPKRPRWNGRNIVTNPIMTPTTTDGSGTYPTGWIWGGVNATISNKQIEVINGQLWATATVTATGANNEGFISIPFSIAAVNANDILATEHEWMFQTSAPQTGYVLKGRLNLKEAGVSSYVTVNTNYTALGVQVAAGQYFGRQVGLPYQCPLAAAALDSANAALYFECGFAEADAVYKIGVSIPRVVNLGQSLSQGVS